MFDASSETARRLIALGRKDARMVLAEGGIDKGHEIRPVSDSQNAGVLSCRDSYHNKREGE